MRKPTNTNSPEFQLFMSKRARNQKIIENIYWFAAFLLILLFTLFPEQVVDFWGIMLKSYLF